jgi:diguanylate cyclase (GGDEF)-like protein/PAS domain S-box-containing protein
MNEDNAAARVDSVATLIEERDAAVAALQRLWSLLDKGEDSVWEMDAERRYVYVNDNMMRTLGYTREELLGSPTSLVVTEEYQQRIVQLAIERLSSTDEALRTGAIRHEGMIRRKDGTTLWTETISLVITDPQGVATGYFGITRDSSLRHAHEEALKTANRVLQHQLEEIKSLHEQLYSQSIRDDLTGIFNRRYFVELSEREILRAIRDKYPVTLVMFDVDHFKRVNDTYGHQAGDEALKTVAQILRTNTRASDIFCRFGGEEFAILLPSASLEAGTKWAEDLRHAIESGTFDSELRLTASFGVAAFPRNADSLHQLIGRADQCLYQAKAGGRNAVRSAPL